MNRTNLGGTHLSCAMLLTMLAIGVPQASAYLILDGPEDFSPTANVIDFDQYEEVTEITDQYQSYGVHFSGVNAISDPAVIPNENEEGGFGITGGVADPEVYPFDPQHAPLLITFVDPITGLPSPVKSAAGGSYIDFFPYIGRIFFYDSDGDEIAQFIHDADISFWGLRAEEGDKLIGSILVDSTAGYPETPYFGPGVTDTYTIDNLILEPGIPEPSSFVLACLGGCLFVGFGWSRRRKVLNGLSHTKILSLLLMFSLIGVCLPGEEASALTIIRKFDTDDPPPLTPVGGGSFYDVMHAAADFWEEAILDDHTLTIEFAWQDFSGGLAGNAIASHSMLGNGGDPKRQTLGRVLFDGDDTTPWFIDPTPYADEEWTTFNTEEQDFGGGLMNTGRWYTGYTGPQIDGEDPFDLLTVAIHEIGHALGPSTQFSPFRDETWPDNDVDVAAPLPFAGAEIPTNHSVVPIDFTNFLLSNPHLSHDQLPNALMTPFISKGLRRKLDAASILANAQLSQFTSVDIDPPTPSGGPSPLGFENFSGTVPALSTFSGGEGELSLLEADFDDSGTVDNWDRLLVSSAYLVADGVSTDPLDVEAPAAELFYDPTTGELWIDSLQAPGGVIGGYVLQMSESGLGEFSPENFLTVLGGTLTTTGLEISEVNPFDPQSGLLSLGSLLPEGLSLAELESMFTVAAYTGPIGSGLNQFNLVLHESSSPVPEPSTFAMATLGLLGLGFYARRRRLFSIRFSHHS